MTVKEQLQIGLSDLRHGVRVFAKAPAFTLVALIGLALGIGSAITIFSIVYMVQFRPLAVGDADRLVYMWTPMPRYPARPRELGPSFADVLAWRASSRSFSHITALQQRMLSLETQPDPVQVVGTIVLGNFFETLEIAPLMGRTIQASDDQPGKERVAVLSYNLWTSQFGGDASAVGRTVRLGGRSYQVVGVMPPEFVYPHENDFPVALRRTAIWVSAGLTVQEQNERRIRTDAAIGRLAPGATLASAQAEMSALQAALDPQNPPPLRGTQSLLVPFRETMVGPVRYLMRLLTGAVVLVLLIVCGNLGSLLLSRAVGLEHEMGVRTALGAPRSRLVRQVLTESLLLSIGGGGLGVLVCLGALRILALLNPGDIPRLEELSMDWRILVFALVVSIVTGVAFGVFPALALERVNVLNLLQEGVRTTAGRSSRMRRVLVVTNVALAVVLLGGAVLLIRSYLRVQGEATGFAPSTLTVRLAADMQVMVPPAKIAAIQRDVVERLASTPGVTAVGATNALPLTQAETLSRFRLEGYPNDSEQTVALRQVAGDYFLAMQSPLIAGRFLTSADIPMPYFSAPPAAVVVNESFAKHYFPGRSAIGGRVQRGSATVWSTIVGVVGDVRHSSLEKPPVPTLFEPSWAVDSVAIRTAMPAEAMVRATRQAIREAGGPFFVADTRTMSERTNAAVARRRFQTVTLATFAAIAVVLALIGLYGLLSHGVRDRTPEIGIRMALGATRGEVLGIVLRDGLIVTGIGLLFGLIGAALLARSAASLLYGVSVLDPVTFIFVPVLMLTAAAAGCLVPAWRASRVNPVNCLRHQ
jgi:predicted permease